ncbi:hypothetical protein UAJ10_08770 [Nitrospirillum sp. BR 11164]|uniref:hypothetical protein n=1 Tax=Nitrospirillum sp. BR 11164 TaxID=3104324 RepID=UPI002AFDE03C|nr:hypothetical protein [Nitrospirillum sp. BR 11164]MEA1649111.1 hypothetical protein [Nitrospirillum sp. BR 11164]
MAIVLDNDWGPYKNANEASAYLIPYVNRVCGPEVGITWATGGFVYPLRAPIWDGGGFGDNVVFQWNHIPASVPNHPPPSDFWHRVKAFIDRCMEAEGQAALAESQANLAMAQAVTNMFNSIAHKDDALAVALDVICVAASIALIPTGLGALGVLAFMGGTFLLGADGAIYGLELAGKDGTANSLRERTETMRIIATVMTLPDIAVGGARALRELKEARELLRADIVTANAAEKLGSRTANMARVDRYAQVAERAHLRSQLRAQQIRAAVTLDIIPRVAGSGSGGLMVREQLSSNEAQGKEADAVLVHQVAERLEVHSVAVQRK